MSPLQTEPEAAVHTQLRGSILQNNLKGFPRKLVYNH